MNEHLAALVYREDEYAEEAISATLIDSDWGEAYRCQQSP